MLNRLICAIALCGGAAVAPAHATDLYAQLFPLTGEIRLLNKSDTPVPFVVYTIDSPSGALNGSSGVWKSITQYYDRPVGPSPGNGLIDPNGDWLKLSSTTMQLAEGALDADGGMLPAFRAVSLGQVWDPQLVSFPDLAFDIRDDQQTIPVTVELALDGDYSSDQIVDDADYIVWRKYLDSLEAWFADGDVDGVVDLDDRLVWQQNFGVTLPLPPYGGVVGGSAAGAVAVPEPTAALLVLLAAGMLAAVARGRRSFLSLVELVLNHNLAFGMKRVP
jgi:hypothetical protein